MRCLLDTCVVSTLTGRRRSEGVAEWIRSQDEHAMYLSVLTIGEIHKGVARLDDRKKRRAILSWVENDLKDRFKGRILDVDEAVARTWGRLQGQAEKDGRRMPLMGSLIAATAVCHDLVVVTRNGADMEASGVEILDPWK